MNQNETASPPLYPHARAARRLRGRPSGLKGRCRARCPTGLRPALDPGNGTTGIHFKEVTPAACKVDQAMTPQVRSGSVKPVHGTGALKLACVPGHRSADFHQVTGDCNSPTRVRIDDSKLDLPLRHTICLAFGGVSIDAMRAMRAMVLWSTGAAVYILFLTP